MGDVGTGSTTKLVNQIIVGLNLVAISKAVLAAKAELIEKVYDAIKGGLAGNAVLDQKIDRFLSTRFSPRRAYDYPSKKDIRNVMDAASSSMFPFLLPRSC